MHGVSWHDEYAYLSDAKNKDIKDKLIARENNNYEGVKSNSFRIFKSLIYHNNNYTQKFYTSVPYRRGDWYYYKTYDLEFPFGIEYKINRNSGETKFCLSYEDLFKNYDNYAMGYEQYSKDGKYIAYSVNYNGDEQYILQVRDVNNRKLLKLKVNNVKGFYWANNDLDLIYDRFVRESNEYSIHRFNIKTKSDSVLFVSKDVNYSFTLLSCTEQDRLFLIKSYQFNDYEVFTFGLDDDNQVLKKVNLDNMNNDLKIDYLKGNYYFLCNKDNLNGAIYIQNENSGKADPLIQGTENEPIVGFDVFNEYLAVNYLENGQSRVKVLNLANQNVKKIEFKQSIYALNPINNIEADTDTLNLSFSSLSRPVTILQYNMKNGQIKIRQKISPYEEFDVKNYEEKLIYITSRDSVLIPMTIVYRKDKLINANPCLLEVYGSYGITDDMGFSETLIKLIDKGWIYAYAHVRGGGEFGEKWYQNGSLMNKKNSINDFIDCTKYLIEQRYTSPGRLAISGGSAGGMVIGAAINEHPELYKAAVLRVPSVDIITPLMDKTDQSALFHHKELGNPFNKEEFDYMYSYSPYHNIKKQNYPHILVTTGENDQRVNPDIPLKWVQKIRDNNTANTTVTINYEKKAGHQGTLGDSRLYTFVIWAITHN
jgi:oligopeptidase B